VDFDGRAPVIAVFQLRIPAPLHLVICRVFLSSLDVPGLDAGRNGVQLADILCVASGLTDGGFYNLWGARCDS
jgi:hypothetical protein